MLLALIQGIWYALSKEAPASRLNRRAGKLRQRFKATNNVTYLNKAIALLERAMTLIEPGSPNMATYTMNLGLALKQRYHAQHKPEDLNRAIACLRDAVAATPAEAPQHAQRTEMLLRAIEEHESAP